MKPERSYIIGVGVTKCGTSSLSQFISNSPLVENYPIKEKRFFDLHYDRGFDYYDGLFAPRPGARYRLDVTPGYDTPEALQRIAAFAPKKKILLCLRHPVERAFSHYVFHIAAHFARGTRPSGSKPDPGETLENFRKPFFGFGANFFDILTWRGLSLVTLYAPIIKNCFALFGRENVHVFIMDRWRQQAPSDIAAELNDFIGDDLQLGGMDRFPRDNPTSMPFYLLFHPKNYLRESFLINTVADLRPTMDQAFMRLGLVVDGKLELLPDLTAEQIDNALRGAALWTDRVPADYAQRIHERFFAADTNEVEDLLQTDLTAWRQFRDLHYLRKLPPLNEQGASLFTDAA